MQKTEAEFRAELETIIQTRKFPGHPMRHHIWGAECTRAEWQAYAQQNYKCLRAFPQALSAIHTACPYLEVRALLAANIYEEDTGELSHTAPHPVLFQRLCAAMGLSPDMLEAAPATRETQSMLSWMTYVTHHRHWVVAAAAILVGMESNPTHPNYVFNAALAKRGRENHFAQKFGLSDDAMTFYRAHELVEGDHGDVGLDIVMKYADTEALQRECVWAVNTTIDIFIYQHMDGVARAAGLDPAQLRGPAVAVASSMG
jgi:pyrroloquinoline-quinone synthase